MIVKKIFGYGMAGSEQNFDILICGTSFTGLTLATALAKIFDGALKIGLIGPSPNQQLTINNSRAFSISATSAQLLQALSIWPALKEYAQPVYKIEITDSPLNAKVRPVLLTYNNILQNGTPASFIVPAHLLGHEILNIFNTLPNTQLLQYQICNNFSSDPAYVNVEANGSNLRAKLLICADGRNSALRQKVGINTLSWAHGQIGIVATVIHEKAHQGTAIQHFLPAGPFAILPLTGNRSCITWSESEQNAHSFIDMQDDDFLEEIDLRFGGRRGALALEGSRGAFSLQTQIARSFIGERFALVGDAAHSVHPIAGQGLNLAFRDIAALCECLIDGARLGLDIADFTVMQRYERWRRFDSTLSAISFSGLNMLFSKDSSPLRSAREFGLGLTEKIPELKSKFVREAAGTSGDLPKLLTGTCP